MPICVEGPETMSLLEGIALLPLAAVVTSLGTIAASCGLATFHGHVPPYPQISMCGMLPPEKYVFSVGMTVSAMLLAVMMVVNHVRLEKLRGSASQGVWMYLTGAHLGVGLSSTICLALMGAVPVSEATVPHVLFACFFFALLIVFQFLTAASRVRELYSDPKQIWMALFMVSTLTGFVWWQTTGSSIAQYLAVASVLLHFAPYLIELRDTTVHLAVEGATDAENDRLLVDRWGEHSRGQGSRCGTSTAVAVLTVVSVMTLLSLVTAHAGLEFQEGQARGENVQHTESGAASKGGAQVPAAAHLFHASRRH